MLKAKFVLPEVRKESWVEICFFFRKQTCSQIPRLTLPFFLFTFFLTHHKSRAPIGMINPSLV